MLRIRDLERVEAQRKKSVGRVEIHDVLESAARDEAHVVDREVAVRVDDCIAVTMEDVAQCEQFEEP